MSPAAAIENLIDDEPRSNTFGSRVSAEVSGIPQTWKFIGACGQSFLVATYASVKLTKLEFRTLDVTAPDIDGSAAGIGDRLMSGVFETSVAPAKLHGKSSRGLHVNMYGLTIGVAAWSHSDRRFVDPQEVIGAHHVIE